MGKLRKIRKAIEKNPNYWLIRQRYSDKMFRAKHAKIFDGRAIPAFRHDPDRGYRMFVRKTLMRTLGYTDDMIE